jgi:hypothetical protein
MLTSVHRMPLRCFLQRDSREAAGARVYAPRARPVTCKEAFSARSSRSTGWAGLSGEVIPSTPGVRLVSGSRSSRQACATTSPISTLLIVTAELGGWFVRSRLTAACAASSDSRMNIEAPLFSPSLTQFPLTKPGACSCHAHGPAARGFPRMSSRCWRAEAFLSSSAMPSFRASSRHPEVSSIARWRSLGSLASSIRA